MALDRVGLVSDKVLPIGWIIEGIFSISPLGYLLCNGQTIGNASSGSTRANEDTFDLYKVLWDNINNTDLPILDSDGNPTTRGVSALDDFNANKRMPLPDLRGRTTVVSGQGASLTNRILGQRVGSETHVLTIAETPSHNHSGGSHNHSGELISGVTSSGIPAATGTVFNLVNVPSSGVIISSNGSGGSHTIVQPVFVVNKYIRFK
jgi:hypothetical protein